MKVYIEERAKMLADQIIKKRTTVRKLAKANCLSKSTVHKDLTQRLEKIDRKRYEKVRRVLNENLDKRSIRGGLATKAKYQKLKRQK